MNELVGKWRSLYELKQIHNQTLEEYTTAYIKDKLVPMWPDGWMKVSDILSHFMPKPKSKEVKKATNEMKTSKPAHSASSVTATAIAMVVENRDNPMMAHNIEKKKAQMVKDPVKLVKTANDKPSLLKTDKKHPLTSPSIRPAATSLLSTPKTDTFITKSVSIFILIII